MSVNRDLAGSAIARARHHEPHLKGRASAEKQGAMLDQARERREFVRWQLMVACYFARPIGASEELLLRVVQDAWPDATKHEVRLNIEYLADRKLVELRKDTGGWVAEANDNGLYLVAEFLTPNPKWSPLPKVLTQLLTQ